jgi:DNA replication initiation complex subunit (GINS family)
LYKAWKAEKTSEKPQPLPNDFYQRAAGYMEGLETDSAASDPHTVQGRLLADERKMAQRLLDELREARLRKIVNAAKDSSAVSTSDLTGEERTLVTHFNESLSSFKERNGPKHSTQQQEERTELSVLRFLDNVPEIVGVDLKIYGPYKKEDVGSLPNQNALALVKQGLAKEIDVKRVPQLSPENKNYVHQQ